jgi:hypothetical protein
MTQRRHSLAPMQRVDLPLRCTSQRCKDATRPLPSCGRPVSGTDIASR